MLEITDWDASHWSQLRLILSYPQILLFHIHARDLYWLVLIHVGLDSVFIFHVIGTSTPFYPIPPRKQHVKGWSGTGLWQLQRSLVMTICLFVAGLENLAHWLRHTSHWHALLLLETKLMLLTTVSLCMVSHYVHSPHGMHFMFLKSSTLTFMMSQFRWRVWPGNRCWHILKITIHAFWSLLLFLQLALIFLWASSANVAFSDLCNLDARLDSNVISIRSWYVGTCSEFLRQHYDELDRQMTSICPSFGIDETVLTDHAVICFKSEDNSRAGTDRSEQKISWQPPRLSTHEAPSRSGTFR